MNGKTGSTFHLLNHHHLRLYPCGQQKMFQGRGTQKQNAFQHADEFEASFAGGVPETRCLEVAASLLVVGFPEGHMYTRTHVHTHT